MQVLLLFAMRIRKVHSCFDFSTKISLGTFDSSTMGKGVGWGEQGLEEESIIHLSFPRDHAMRVDVTESVLFRDRCSYDLSEWKEWVGGGLIPRRE